MNRTFFWRFLSKKSGARFNFAILMPFFGVFLGVLVVSLTFAVMDGLEAGFVGKLESFDAKIRINTKALGDSKEQALKDSLSARNILHFRMLERKSLIAKGDAFRMANIRAIEDFPQFIESQLSEFTLQYSDLPDSAIFVAGANLAIQLNANVSDDCQIHSPLDMNIMTALAPTATLKLGKTFAIGIMDYDLNFAFIPYKVGEALFKKSVNRSILCFSKFTAADLKALQNGFPDAEFLRLEDRHKELIAALKMEKLAYSTFGFFILLIAGFNFLSMMSMSVMQKIPQIGILKAIGYSRVRIRNIFFWQAIGTSLSASILGFALAYAIIALDRNIGIIDRIFGNAQFIIFDMQLGIGRVIFISIFTMAIILLSSLYPALRAQKMNTVRAINSKI